MSKKILLEVDGVSYEGFTDITVFDSMELASGSFSFTATTEKQNYLPFKGQQSCRVLIDDTPLITGYIESASYKWSNNQHVVRVSGRDKTADIVDSTLAGNIDLKAPVSLVTVFYRVFNALSIDCTVSNTVTGLEDFNESEIVVGKIGENAFDFLEKYCRKRAVVMTSDGNGNVVITRAGTQKLNGILINQLNGANNNLLSGGIEYDFTNRYKNYTVRSQGNPSSAELYEELGITLVEGVNATAVDSGMRASRTLEMLAETSSTTASAQLRADWEANIRRARAFRYECEVADFFTNSKETERYEKNKKILLIDEFCDFKATMLIQSVQYEKSSSGGTNLTLTLVPPNAYTPEPSVNEKDAKSNLIGENVVES